jgi:predicted dehydrogenase
MSTSFGFHVPRDESDRLLNNSLAGGALLDMGIYCLTMSQFVMQKEPTFIVADSYIGVTNVDERTSAILNYAGVGSQFTCDLNANLDNNFVIYGSKGHITIPSMFWAATQAKLCIEGEGEELIDIPFRATGFEYQIEEVMQCIQQGKLQSDVLSWADSISTLRIMDSIRHQVGLNYEFLGQFEN